MDFLSIWSSAAVPLTPVVCLLGDKSQLPNVSKGIFSVIMVGLVSASRIILSHWKTAVSPDLKDCINTMVETASYESMLNRLKGNMDDGTIPWELFWTYTRTDENSVQSTSD